MSFSTHNKEVQMGLSKKNKKRFLKAIKKTDFKSFTYGQIMSTTMLFAEMDVPMKNRKNKMSNNAQNTQEESMGYDQETTTLTSVGGTSEQKVGPMAKKTTKKATKKVAKKATKKVAKKATKKAAKKK